MGTGSVKAPLWATLALAIASALPVYGQKASAAPTGMVDSKPTFVLKQFAVGQPLRLIAYGDMRFTDPATVKGTNPKLRQWLAAQIGKENPQALLLTGDMPFIGEKKEDWDEYRKETASWKADGFPVFPAMGNHEIYHDYDKGVANFLESYPDLQGHRYYSAVLGSVEVMALDMTEPVGPHSLQGQWFAAQLDRLPRSVEFLMILYHIPWVADTQSQLVASLPTPDALTLRTMLEDRLGRVHAKVIVFSGHIHNYERFERHGVEYVVTGGGGAEPYPILYRGSHDLYRDTAFPVFNYVTIEVADHRLKAVMYKVANPDAPASDLRVEAKDSFTIQSGLRSDPARGSANPANAARSQTP